MAVSLLLRFFAWRRAATVQRQNALAAREAAAALVDPERQKLKEWPDQRRGLGLFTYIKFYKYVTYVC